MISDITLLAQSYQLGRILKTPEPVTGGRSHKIWKLKTEKGSFAVKGLLMNNTDSTRLAELRETERLAYRLNQQQFPALAALQYNQEPIFTLGCDHYVIYPWLEGYHILPAQVNPQHAYGIGSALSKLHQFPTGNSKLANFAYTVLLAQEWHTLADKLASHHLPYVALLAANLDTLIKLDAQGNSSFAKLQQNQVISHGDLDPYNVLWFDEQSLCVIDWELASLSYPVIDFVATLLYWSLAGLRIKTDCVQGFISGYQLSERFKGLIEPAVYVVLGHWLKWLEFNLRRAIATNDSALKLISITEAQKTLDTVVYLAPLIADLTHMIENFLVH